MKALVCALAFCLTFALPQGVRAENEPMPMPMSHARYLGPPDLALTSAMIAAGGGPRHFKAATLAGALFAQHRDAEVASLERRYGAQRVTTFLRTFDTFVDRAIGIVVKDKIPLPKPQPALAHDSYELAASLRGAGVMPDGRFDVGYFIEHLLSRPMHKTLMDEVNGDPQYGPAVNADFHVILTAMMDDLKTLYDLPH